MNSGAAFVWMDRHLDTTREGPQWLAKEEIAEVVEGVLHRQECELHAYVVMPNHVHVLFTPGIAPARLMQLIKGASAREAANHFGNTSPTTTRCARRRNSKKSEGTSRITQ